MPTLNENLIFEALNATFDGVYVAHLQQNRLMVSDAWFRLLHLSYGDFDGTWDFWLKRIHPDDRRQMAEHLAPVSQMNLKDAPLGPFHLEYRVCFDSDNSKSFIWVQDRGILKQEDGELRRVGTVCDITEIKQQKVHHEKLTEIMPIGVFHAGEDGVIEYANRQANLIFEPVRKKVLNDSWFHYLHPEDRNRVESLWRDVFRKSKVVDAVCRIEGITKTRWLHFKSIPLEALGTATPTALTTLEDITWHRENAIYLQEQGQFLSTVLNNLPVLLMTMDLDGKALWVNEQMEATLGVASGSLTGVPVFSQFSSAGSNANVAIQRLITVESGWYELEMTGPMGSVIPTSWTSRRLVDNRIVCMGNNLTDEFRLKKEIEHQQVQLINASKLSSLGEMAGGIAHEINNPLAIINAAAARIRRHHHLEKGLDRDPVTDSVDLLEKTVDRISRIIKGLRTFARDGDKDPFVIMSVETIIEDTLGLCQERLHNHGIVTKIEQQDKPVYVQCRPVQLSQILLNLINNAFDAVRDLENRWIRIEVRTADNNIDIAVTDSGEGINPELADKIMQPFYTTKIASKGTGLGLSISQTLAKEHGGAIRLDPSSPNTCFILTLPLAKKGKSVA